MTYRFHPAAEAEHLEMVAWYESRRAGLGARYLAEFEQVLKQVCASPSRHPLNRAPMFAEPGCGDSRSRFSIGRLEVTSRSWRWRITDGGRRTGSSGSSLRPYKVTESPEPRPRRSLHIQVSLADGDLVRIITLYEPLAEEWIEYSRRRR